MRGNPAGGGRSAAPPVRTGAPINKRLRGMVNTVAEDVQRIAGLPKERADRAARRAEEILQEKEAR